MHELSKVKLCDNPVAYYHGVIRSHQPFLKTCGQEKEPILICISHPVAIKLRVGNPRDTLSNGG
jgi:hypothetical protein